VPSPPPNPFQANVHLRTDRTFNPILSMPTRIPVYLAILVAWVAMLGSLYFSEVAGFVPCKLCWYQRILMYPLALILPIAALRRDDGVPAYVLPFSVTGIFVSTYHYLLQKTNIFSGSSVCTGGVPCNIAYINWLGFITIPFLALTAFVIISLLMLIFYAQKGQMQTEEQETTVADTAVARR
jgi:disulfide bond formation protein DsbB